MITIELRTVPQNKLFDFDYDFYSDDIEIRKQFEKLFRDYYLFDEIGYETIGRFKQRLMTRLNMKAPYYRQLYETEMACKKIDFMLNKDYKETMKKVNKGQVNNKGTNENNSNSDSNTEGIIKNKGSNIDNGNASLNLTQGSLTNVNEDINNSTLNENINQNGSYENTSNKNDTEEYELIGQGNIGTTSSAELLSKWREVLINLNEIIILDCRDLFMMIY